MSRYSEMIQLQLLVLIGIANGAPILAENMLHRRLDYPVDCHVTFVDGRRLLGSSKTIRGLLAALLTTTAGALSMGLPASLGAWIAVAAMSGDLMSSFIKRRLGIPASGMALGLDQIPEVMLPLLIVQSNYDLEWEDILKLTLLFLVFELFISRILFRLHLRKQPY